MLRDYIRPTDLKHVPDEYMALYDDGSEQAGALVYAAGGIDRRPDCL